MSPIAFAATACALIVASAIAGAFLRLKLPEHHLTGDSKDVIKLAIALIATMSALVLALLFASTRTSFERTSGYVSRMTADIVELDRLLQHYGPEAAPVRQSLRAEIGPLIDSIWRDDAIARGVNPDTNTAPEETALYLIQDLVPKTGLQRAIQTRALQVGADLTQTQLALFSQPSDSISNTFVIVLILWLMVIFAIFSMSSPPNPTLFVVLGICILSASGAIYLIMELGLPFGGLMQLSNEGLRSALR
ncbi:hypothetical protein [Reyranella sp.]|uniref:bestrophin-like domain n=1 Tax=Reyranella sp. TaxID=1929291 RepID=UPI0027313F59|nr:hypothetical protein [Reyranella sp.]MDP2372452.1 hypothetical protein [Reyranella sp.]